MATRKSLVLVSGLFQELNSSSDKLDFAGNTTADLTENTNLYYTDARSRASVSVTDSGGEGSLAYNNTSGVITYTGPSDSDIRGKISVAGSSGLTYNSSTGVLDTDAIPNAQLANSSVTVGSTSIALGATASTIAGLTSLTATTLYAGTADAANSVAISSSGVVFEGATADAYETTLTVTDPTADRTVTLPNETGTVLTTATSIANGNLANSAVTIGSTSLSLGATATTFTGVSSLTATSLIGTTVYAGAAGAANSISLSSSGIIFEGATADAYETTLTVTDATADRTITFPNSTGTVALLGSLSVAGGSGLTYNSSTGAFGTSSIPNVQLANDTVTVGSTSIALGSSATTITGVSSFTCDAIVTDDDGFRVRDNSDNTKQLAFECSGIATSTTRTMTVPNSNGTIATEAYVDAKVTAEDLDITTDSGSISIDLDSATLTLTGGTGIDTSATGSTVTYAINSTVATLTGSQTLTNKTLTAPTVSSLILSDGSIIFEGATADAYETTLTVTDPTADRTLTLPNATDTLIGRATTDTLTNKTLTSAVLNSTISGTSIKDEDNMSSDSASHLATQQSIKAYVDTQITAEDLDIQTDSGNIDIDLDSEALVLTGGTGINTSATGTTVTYAIDSTVATLTGTQTLTNKTLTGVSGLTLSDASIVFEGATADAYETTLTVTDPTADRTITIPNSTGTVALLGSLSVAGGSGLTYNSSTGAFGTSSIPNAQLANSTVTVGTTGIALGSSATTIAGVSSLTSSAIVTDDSGFRIRDNSDNTKQLAFECSGISGSTTRTLTVQDVNGTVSLIAATETLTNKTLTSPVLNSSISGTSIKDEDNMASDSATHLATQQSIKAYVDTKITAEDLDITTDSGNIDIDLDSEALALTGGTGINTSATGTTVTYAIDSTVATLTGAQTLTNKTITAPIATSILLSDSNLIFEGSTADAYETTLTVVDPTADRTISLPNATDTLVGLATTDTLTNKTLTSAVLNSTISGTSIKDEDNMSSDSATHLATQQSIKAYVDTKVTAEDLDVQTDSGNIDIDLDSEALILTGGTGIDTSGSGTTATFAIDATVATLVGSQTLTNKTLTSPVLNTGLSGNAFLDEDNMASDSATKVASQQSIKAYVDTKVTAEDLDITTDSGSIAIDLDSATLVLTGGTGIDTSATGSTVTYAIDSTVATLAGSQTLTNKTLTSPTINAALLTGSINLTGAVLSGASPLVFEGATANAYETTLAVTDPTADRTITLPDDSGTMATESFATAIAVALG